MLKVKQAMEMFKNVKCNDSIYIPINDLLENLKAYEITGDNVEEMLMNNENIEPCSVDNSYNSEDWLSPLSNQVIYFLYEDLKNDKYYMELKINMEDDYTDSLWFVNNYTVEGFVRVLDDTMKTIQVDYNGYTVMASYTVLDELGSVYVTIEQNGEIVEKGIGLYLDSTDLEDCKKELIDKLIDKGLLQ